MHWAPCQMNALSTKPKRRLFSATFCVHHYGCQDEWGSLHGAHTGWMGQISSQCDVLYIKYLDFSNQQNQFSLIIHSSTHPSTHLSSHPAICPLCIFQFFIHNLSLAVWIVWSHISRAQVLVPNQLEHWRLLALIKDIVTDHKWSWHKRYIYL